LVHDSQVTLRPDVLSDDPALALRFYEAVAREGLPPDPEARDAIATLLGDRDQAQALRRSAEAKASFCALLTHAGNAPLRRGSIVEELHEVGLLVAMVPEFEPIMGRVPYDAYHAYTADMHSLLAVDRLRAIARGELATEFPIVSRCAAELPRPLPLYLALLLHELGAGHPDDPAKYAAAVASTVCERLGIGPADSKHTQWLIANQHRVYRWALQRDITDPETIAEIVREVQTVDRLRDLYLLTFANTSTENPTAMTAWNARMLQELWLTTSDRIESLREQVLRECEDRERSAVRAFLAELPERYLLANSTDEIRMHQAIAAGRGDETRVRVARSSFGEGTLQIVVLDNDRPGLLAELTAALSLNRYNVDSAQLYTRKREGCADEAFDIFAVTHPGLGIESDLELHIAELSRTIEELKSGQGSAERAMGRRSRLPSWARSGPRIKTEVGVDNNTSSLYTVVDVYTRDRPELLHTIARTLHQHGLTIALAKVNTQGRRVADVFYVQSQAGGKLAKGQLARLSDALRETIHKLDG
jgi:[protein-PII] uridylyltransferase